VRRERKLARYSQGLDDDIFIKTKLQHSASAEPSDKASLLVI
jgi:hypothetical protein